MLPRTLQLFFRNISRTYLCRNFSTVTAPNTEQNKGGDRSDEIDSILKCQDYFNVHNIFTVKDMFDAKVHLGHKEVSLQDGMRPFVFGSRLGHVIFDLDITAYHLRKALNFCAHVAHRDGIILFISHNKRCTLMVERTAKECKEFAFTRFWKLGIFTDSTQVFNFETRLPDLCIMLNTRFDSGQPHPAIVEAARLLIPVVAVTDSDCNPNLITYPVPGNDDTPSSVEFFCNAFKTAILRGKNARIKDNKNSSSEI